MCLSLSGLLSMIISRSIHVAEVDGRENQVPKEKSTEPKKKKKERKKEKDKNKEVFSKRMDPEKTLVFFLF